MSHSKEEVFTQLKHELQSGAMNRMDTGEMYIFLKEVKTDSKKYNLLVFDVDRNVNKRIYGFAEKDGNYFLTIESEDYEIILPEAISDSEPFTLSVKKGDGSLVVFENFI